jgi:hypothetical protein
MLILPFLTAGAVAVLTWLTTDWSLLAEQRWESWFRTSTIGSGPMWELDYWTAKIRDYVPQLPSSNFTFQDHKHTTNGIACEQGKQNEAYPVGPDQT